LVFGPVHKVGAACAENIVAAIPVSRANRLPKSEKEITNASSRGLGEFKLRLFLRVLNIFRLAFFWE